MSKLVSLNPPPGAYNIPTFIASGPKYIMSGKYEEGETAIGNRAVPGPGSYDLKSLRYKDSSIRKDPTYRIGTADRFGPNRSRDIRTSPGPGNYNTVDSSN